LKLQHPSRLEYEGTPHQRPKQYLHQVDRFRRSKREKHVIATVISERREFAELLAASAPRIFTLPSRTEHYAFTRVRDGQGRLTGEWISRMPIPIAACSSTPVESIEDAMRYVQVLFLADGITQDDWWKISTEIRKILPPDDKSSDHRFFQKAI
jgi:hypothetical protein